MNHIMTKCDPVINANGIEPGNYAVHPLFGAVVVSLPVGKERRDTSVGECIWACDVLQGATVMSF